MPLTLLPPALCRVVRVFCGPNLLLLALSLPFSAAAAPLSKSQPIDFYREVPSRSLKGLATRSDGRLLLGPVVTDLAGPALADVLWSLEPAGPDRWLVGTGPQGRILEVSLTGSTYTTRDVVTLDATQVMCVRRLADGSILAGTSPEGALFLVKDGQVVAKALLPADSIWDILVLPSGTALVATGNPARIYAVDVAAFAKAGVQKEKLSLAANAADLAKVGLRLWSEVRDRNLRTLAYQPAAAGRAATVWAGSAPKGRIYRFAETGGEPAIAHDGRDGEVTALLPAANGDLYATLVYAPEGSGESRVNRSRARAAATAAPTDENAVDPAVAAAAAATANTTQPVVVTASRDSAGERFPGRSVVVWLPAGGFPETIVNRQNLAFYQLARRGDTLLISGGEQGELLGYDLVSRFNLTYAGSASSQLNQLAATDATGTRFLALRNNAPGLTLIDFGATTAAREAETRRIDVSVPATLGALRFSRLRGIKPAQISASLRTTLGGDDIEGWTPWTPLAARADDAWSAPAGTRARYYKLKLTLAADAPADTELDRASLFYLGQNRRPTLQEFHLLPPNYALVPPGTPGQSTSISLGQLISGREPGEARSASIQSAQVVPSPGAQVVTWTVADADNDEIVATFSLRREGTAEWTDVLVDTTEPYAQFDRTPLADGVYFTRLTLKETAPRAEADRLAVTFETDDLVIDRTPPEILEAKAERRGANVIVTVRGRDALSLLENLEVNFNNGRSITIEQPADGVLDGREETFVAEIPASELTHATAVEVLLYDASGNRVAKRLGL